MCHRRLIARSCHSDRPHPNRGDSIGDLPLLPDQPTATDQVRRFGPPTLIALIALLFVLQNTDSVPFSFLWFEFTWPLWIMLLVFMAIGAAVFYGVARRRRWRKARRDKRDAE